ncbi:class I SAM-dependent methyltransferase [Mumia sp. DW29H23]|uniref:class I SAM-dependent methyltransferase n=1 Tax=Mumia sp. DW29H23 TaxID=3421241 RepID=UPI003D6921D2
MSGQPTLDTQRRAWNDWNAASREVTVGQSQLEQAGVIEAWIAREPGPLEGRRLLDVGCGAGWLTDRLRAYGEVVGIDLADEVVARTRERLPDVTLIAGDFLQVDLPDESFDVIVSCEVLSHVADQRAFVDRCHRLLKPGGFLMIATQNRPIYERHAGHFPNPGWHRRWLDRHELRSLIASRLDVVELRSITPKFFSGPLRIVNSERLERVVRRVGLWPVLRRIKSYEERRFLGSTLVCLARKRGSC